VQKVFVPRINGCGEHIDIANIVINTAMTTKKVLSMLARDMKDDYGFASQNQLDNNLKKMNQCKPMK
jgi:hypothetical protein